MSSFITGVIRNIPGSSQIIQTVKSLPFGREAISHVKGVLSNSHQIESTLRDTVSTALNRVNPDRPNDGLIKYRDSKRTTSDFEPIPKAYADSPFTSRSVSYKSSEEKIGTDLITNSLSSFVDQAAQAVGRFGAGAQRNIESYNVFQDRTNLSVENKSITENAFDRLLVGDFSGAGQSIYDRAVTDPFGTAGEIASEVGISVATMGAAKAVKGIALGARASSIIKISQPGRIGGTIFARALPEAYAETVSSGGVKQLAVKLRGGESGINIGSKYAPVQVPERIKNKLTVFLDDGNIARINKDNSYKIIKPRSTNLYNLGERIELRAIELGVKLRGGSSEKMAKYLINSIKPDLDETRKIGASEIEQQIIDVGRKISGLDREQFTALDLAIMGGLADNEVLLYVIGKRRKPDSVSNFEAPRDLEVGENEYEGGKNIMGGLDKKLGLEDVENVSGKMQTTTVNIIKKGEMERRIKKGEIQIIDPKEAFPSFGNLMPSDPNFGFQRIDDISLEPLDRFKQLFKTEDKGSSRRPGKKTLKIIEGDGFTKTNFEEIKDFYNKDLTFELGLSSIKNGGLSALEDFLFQMRDRKIFNIVLKVDPIPGVKPEYGVSQSILASSQYQDLWKLIKKSGINVNVLARKGLSTDSSGGLVKKELADVDSFSAAAITALYKIPTTVYDDAFVSKSIVKETSLVMEPTTAKWFTGTKGKTNLTSLTDDGSNIINQLLKGSVFPQKDRLQPQFAKQAQYVVNFEDVLVKYPDANLESGVGVFKDRSQAIDYLSRATGKKEPELKNFVIKRFDEIIVHERIPASVSVLSKEAAEDFAKKQKIPSYELTRYNEIILTMEESSQRGDLGSGLYQSEVAEILDLKKSKKSTNTKPNESEASRDFRIMWGGPRAGQIIPDTFTIDSLNTDQKMMFANALRRFEDSVQMFDLKNNRVFQIPVGPNQFKWVSVLNLEEQEKLIKAGLLPKDFTKLSAYTQAREFANQPFNNKFFSKDLLLKELDKRSSVYLRAINKQGNSLSMTIMDLDNATRAVDKKNLKLTDISPAEFREIFFTTQLFSPTRKDDIVRNTRKSKITKMSPWERWRAEQIFQELFQSRKTLPLSKEVTSNPSVDKGDGLAGLWSRNIFDVGYLARSNLNILTKSSNMPLATSDELEDLISGKRSSIDGVGFKIVKNTEISKNRYDPNNFRAIIEGDPKNPVPVEVFRMKNLEGEYVFQFAPRQEETIMSASNVSKRRGIKKTSSVFNPYAEDNKKILDAFLNQLREEQGIVSKQTTGTNLMGSSIDTEASRLFWDSPFVKSFRGYIDLNNIPDGVVVVIGTNDEGIQGAGMAKAAFDANILRRGEGIGISVSGKVYALPTRYVGVKTKQDPKGTIRTRNLENIQKDVDDFLKYARANPTKIFLVPDVGTGLAGIPVKDMALMFRGGTEGIPKNVILSEKFTEQLALSDSLWGTRYGKTIGKVEVVDISPQNLRNLSKSQSPNLSKSQSPNLNLTPQDDLNLKLTQEDEEIKKLLSETIFGKKAKNPFNPNITPSQRLLGSDYKGLKEFGLDDMYKSGLFQLNKDVFIGKLNKLASMKPGTLEARTLLDDVITDPDVKDKIKGLSPEQLFRLQSEQRINAQMILTSNFMSNNLTERILKQVDEALGIDQPLFTGEKPGSTAHSEYLPLFLAGSLRDMLYKKAKGSRFISKDTVNIIEAGLGSVKIWKNNNPGKVVMISGGQKGVDSVVTKVGGYFGFVPDAFKGKGISDDTKTEGVEIGMTGIEALQARTKANVIVADGLIAFPGDEGTGTELAIQTAKSKKIPVLKNPKDEVAISKFISKIQKENPNKGVVINIAGTRQSGNVSNNAETLLKKYRENQAGYVEGSVSNPFMYIDNTDKRQRSPVWPALYPILSRMQTPPLSFAKKISLFQPSSEVKKSTNRLYIPQKTGNPVKNVNLNQEELMRTLAEGTPEQQILSKFNLGSLDQLKAGSMPFMKWLNESEEGKKLVETVTSKYRVKKTAQSYVDLVNKNMNEYIADLKKDIVSTMEEGNFGKLPPADLFSLPKPTKKTGDAGRPQYDKFGEPTKGQDTNIIIKGKEFEQLFSASLNNPFYLGSFGSKIKSKSSPTSDQIARQQIKKVADKKLSPKKIQKIQKTLKEKWGMF